MAIHLKIPYLSYLNIAEIAFNFLREQGHAASIPIPIEEIADLNLRINIMPVPGLKSARNVDGYVLGDLDTIEVDEYVYEKVKKRFRYTVAHELGHIILHKDVFKEAKRHYTSVEGWMDFYAEIDEQQHQWLEYQAYSFGGLVLVPQAHLERIFVEKVEEHRSGFEEARANKIPKTAYSDYFMIQVERELAQIFNVSGDVIRKRLDKDKLTKHIP